MSLPSVFATELQSPHVPISTQQPCPQKLRLQPPPGGLNVGLVWASNPDNKAMYRNKSIRLLLMPFLTIYCIWV